MKQILTLNRKINQFNHLINCCLTFSLRNTLTSALYNIKFNENDEPLLQSTYLKTNGKTRKSLLADDYMIDKKQNEFGFLKKTKDVINSVGNIDDGEEVEKVLLKNFYVANAVIIGINGDDSLTQIAFIELNSKFDEDYKNNAIHQKYGPNWFKKELYEQCKSELNKEIEIYFVEDIPYSLSLKNNMAESEHHFFNAKNDEETISDEIYFIDYEQQQYSIQNMH